MPSRPATAGARPDVSFVPGSEQVPARAFGGNPEQSTIEPMAHTALVLGAGDTEGVAWQAGVLAGLAEAGLDLRADRVIGTSAGALLAARLTTGVSAQRLADTVGAELIGVPPVSWMVGLSVAAVGWHPSHRHAVQRLGERSMRRWSRALQAHWVEWLAPDLAGRPWPRPLVIVASNAVTGRPVYFTADQPVDLASAVAASWAVPGVQPAVQVESEWCIDGRLRTPLNLDAATGAQSVIAVAPRLGIGDLHRCGPRQARGLRGGGGTVRLMRPDAASRWAMRIKGGLCQGMGPIVAAGRRQGQFFGEQLAGRWPG